jgi:hypothetical protein
VVQAERHRSSGHHPTAQTWCVQRAGGEQGGGGGVWGVGCGGGGVSNRTGVARPARQRGSDRPPHPQATTHEGEQAGAAAPALGQRWWKAGGPAREWPPLPPFYTRSPTSMAQREGNARRPTHTPTASPTCATFTLKVSTRPAAGGPRGPRTHPHTWVQRRRHTQ